MKEFAIMTFSLLAMGAMLLGLHMTHAYHLDARRLEQPHEIAMKKLDIVDHAVGATQRVGPALNVWTTSGGGYMISMGTTSVTMSY